MIWGSGSLKARPLGTLPVLLFLLSVAIAGGLVGFALVQLVFLFNR